MRKLNIITDIALDIAGIVKGTPVKISHVGEEGTKVTYYGLIRDANRWGIEVVTYKDGERGFRTRSVVFDIKEINDKKVDVDILD